MAWGTKGGKNSKFHCIDVEKIYERKSWEVQGNDKEIKYERKKIDVPFTLSLKHLFIMWKKCLMDSVKCNISRYFDNLNFFWFIL